jgi:hypothetical protein
MVAVIKKSNPSPGNSIYRSSKIYLIGGIKNKKITKKILFTTA